MSVGLKKQGNIKFNGFYRADVLDNVDPDKLGRVKLRVYPMFHSIDVADIPWAVPAMGIFTGAGSSYGSFSVPEIGSSVWTFFEAGQIYQPVYFAEAQTRITGLPTMRTTNYPNRRGFSTKAGIEVFVDDTAKEVKISHPTGTTIKIGTAGNVEIHTVDKVKIEEDGGSSIEIANTGIINVISIGAINVTASGTITVSAPLVTINP